MEEQNMLKIKGESNSVNKNEDLIEIKKQDEY